MEPLIYWDEWQLLTLQNADEDEGVDNGPQA